MSWLDKQALAQNVLFGGAAFGEDVVYTPLGGVAKTVRAVFFERPVEVEGLDLQGSRILSSEIALGLRQQDLTAGKVEHGAGVVLVKTGVAYTVREVGRPNETGEVRCSLGRVGGA